MPRLPKFDRVLVVVAPHGDLIASGAKTALVKSRRYRVEGDVLLVVQKKRALGTLRLAPPRAIGLAEFRRLRPRHLVGEAERRRWWPRKAVFHMYKVVEFRPLRAPVPVDYPRGPRVFVRPESLRVRAAAPAGRKGRPSS